MGNLDFNSNEMNTDLIEIKNAIPRINFFSFSTPINWKIKKGEQWAVIGANGSGKTLLIEILTGKYGLKSGEISCKDECGKQYSIRNFVKYVAFKDIYSLTDCRNSYYQQRWNIGLEEDIPLVKDFLKQEDNQEWVNHLISTFRINDLLNKKINLLSSGELRKFLLVKSLASKPRILIIDQPFIGLDSHSRRVLNEVFNDLIKFTDLQIILLVSDIADIPPLITHILPIIDCNIFPFQNFTDFINNKDLHKNLFKSRIDDHLLSKLPKSQVVISYNNAILFKDINISYDKRTILNHLSWTVKKGEKWALLGPNGSGKSTLLSLIVADNPQAYANDITLFDQPRGTGESIWDIKRNIGYISPEMHLYYQKNVCCLDVVSSGFFDTIGLYNKCTEIQKEIALLWMKILGIESLHLSSFLNISTGEQRLVLLARIFVKDPSLLILDEPLHGLDMDNKKKIIKLLNLYCSSDKTVIFVSHYKEEIPEIINHELVLTKH